MTSQRGATGTYSEQREDQLYGLDRELAEKAAAKYDVKAEQEARVWIEAVTGAPLEGSFQEALKSGVALCELVRALKPDIIKPPSKMSAPFKQMENIGNYLAACTKLGLAAHDSFQTVDLFEGKNMGAVVIQLHRLGGIAQKLPGYAGPPLGIKASDVNKRDFTEEQLRAASAEPTFMGKGSHGTPAEGMKTTELLGSQINKTNIETKDKIKGLGGGSDPTFLGGAVDISETVRADTFAQGAAAGDMPSSAKGAYVSAEERDARMAADGGKLLYGMDKELADKQAAKFDTKMEAEARAWIEAITGETLEGSTHEVLKSGVVLCNLVRAVEPDIIKPPSKMSAPFKQMENISNYLAACRKLGAQEHDSFQTVDLFEDANMLAVLIQIHAFGRLLQKRPNFSGPVLGVKESTANAREFTAEQLAAAKAEQTFLGKGSHGTAGGAMSKVDTGRVQVRGNVAGTEGLGTGGEQTMIGTGSSATPGAKMDVSENLGNKIVKGDITGTEGLGTGGEQTFGK